MLTHFIVSSDVDRSRRSYTDVLGGELVLEGEPSIVALANGWVIINLGGGPTDDKPTIRLEPPRDPNRVSSFLNVRVADIEAIYADWSAWRRVPHAAGGPRTRAPLLSARSGRALDRGRPSDWSTGGQGTPVFGNGRMSWTRSLRLPRTTSFLENERVRVIQTLVPAGAITPVHTHRWASVEYVLSTTNFVRSDGEGNVLLDTRAALAEPRPSDVLWVRAASPALDRERR